MTTVEEQVDYSPSNPMTGARGPSNGTRWNDQYAIRARYRSATSAYSPSPWRHRYVWVAGLLRWSSTRHMRTNPFSKVALSCRYYAFPHDGKGHAGISGARVERMSNQAALCRDGWSCLLQAIHHHVARYSVVVQRIRRHHLYNLDCCCLTLPSNDAGMPEVAMLIPLSIRRWRLQTGVLPLRGIGSLAHLHIFGPAC